MNLKERAEIFKIISTAIADELNIQISAGDTDYSDIIIKDKKDNTINSIKWNADLGDLLDYISRARLASILANLDKHIFEQCLSLAKESKSNEIDHYAKTKDELKKYVAKYSHGKIKFTDDDNIATVRYHINDLSMVTETYRYNKTKDRYERESHITKLI
jgi:hypothetical protein